MAFVFNDLQFQETPNKNGFSSSLTSLIESIIFCPLLTHGHCAFVGESFFPPFRSDVILFQVLQM